MRLGATELQLARSSPAGFAYATSVYETVGGERRHRWLPFAHLRHLNDRILAALAGELHAEGKTGLIVSMPPRHGKSELTSRTLPAWFLGRYPHRKVILAGYQQRFADTWGRKARDLLEEWGPEVFGVRVSDASAAADLWELDGTGGAMRTAGVGGAITGFGADLLLVDDPVKNAQDAASEVMRANQWDWWTSTARTRLHAGGTAIIVATRWHEDDLIGRLIDAAAEDPEADQWEVVNLAAICEPDDQGEFDDALGRQEGQPLCRELGYDETWARKTRASVGSYVWYALYQGRPRPADGLLYKRTDFRHFRVEAPSEQWPQGLYVLEDEGGLHPVDPGQCVHFQTADTADSEKEMADYTVVATWAVTPVDRKLLLVNVERAQFERERAGTMLEASWRAATPRPVKLVVENAGPSGPKVIRHLLNQGLPITSANPDTDKVTRALPAVALYEQHRVYHRHGDGAPWLRDLEDELLAFPNGAHDDQADTVAYAALELPKLTGGGVRQRETAPRRTAGLKTKQL